MAILIIEDEEKVNSFLSSYSMDTALKAPKGLDILMKYQLIILDVPLPDINSIEFCQKIRETSSTPILILTPMGTDNGTITGPDGGADYSLRKPSKELPPGIKLPFSPSPLAVCKTSAEEDPELNNGTNVSKYGTIIDLTASEHRLLEYLIKNKGKVLSRADIAENVWTLGFDTGPNIIQVYFNYLKKKIDKNFTPKLIHTLLGWDMF